ncbi:MAG TPA: hypothetical protein GXX20_04530 [Clostridiaceae bacterium]|nr:hypothetical protein [Clostridiaceae bacterium]
MQKNNFFKLIVYIGVILLLYLTILSVFVKTPEMLNIPSYIVVCVEIVFLFIVMGLLYFFYKKCKPLSSKIFSIVLALAALIPRIIWVVFIDTAPTSDFYGYNNYAINASKGYFQLYGDVYPLFPFKFGYSLILSVLYRIFGTDIIVAKLFNVALSVGTVFLVYKLGEKIFNERSGRIAGLIFSFWPAQIMYNSVAASEHIFMLFFLLAVWFFILVETNEKNARNYILAAASGSMIALAYLIRPVSMILIPILILCLFVFWKEDRRGKSSKQNKQRVSPEININSSKAASKGPSKRASNTAANSTSNNTLKNASTNTTLKKTLNTIWKPITGNKIKISFAVLASAVITVAVVDLTVGNLLGVRLWRSSSGFSFYIGTNYESSGMYSAKDEEIIQEFDYDFKEVHGQATKRAIERIVSQPMNFLRLIEKKFIIQWTNEDYGYYWSMYELYSTNDISSFVLSHPRAFLGTSQIYYIAIIVLAAAGTIYIKRHSIYPAAAIHLLFFAFVGAHTLFEVQSRYHYPVIPFLTILGGYGGEQVIGKLLARKPFSPKS